MKIAASTYSFQQYLNDGRLTQLDCIAKAQAMGFDAVEFVGIQPHDGSTVEQYAEKLGNEARRLNFPVTNYTIGADFLNGCDGDHRAEVKRVKQQVDLAVLLGASGMRHDATAGYPADRFRGFGDVLPRLADCCREVTEYAARQGIKTMVENHGFFCQDSDRVEALAGAVNHPNFGLLVDMGNFLCADENPVTAVGRVAPYAFYAHAKDFHVKSGMAPHPGDGFFRSRGGNALRGAIVGHGDVPVRQCLIALKRAGYNGDIAIEFEGMEDALTGLSIGLSNLRRYIAEAEACL